MLTCAKPTLFCQTQHRTLPGLRRRAPDPEVMLHPLVAAQRGIAAGDRVSVETPVGGMRARALLNADIDPRVVVGEHGWWQAAPDAGALTGWDVAPRRRRHPEPVSREPPAVPASGRSGHDFGVGSTGTGRCTGGSAPSGSWAAAINAPPS